MLRAWFDPAPLDAELVEAERSAFADNAHRNTGGARNTFRYAFSANIVPVMSELTPVSLDLARSLATMAEGLLGQPVLPGRSKVTIYFGSTDWHRDSHLPLRGLGMVIYLEALDATNGALSVVPGSHQWASNVAIDSGGPAGEPSIAKSIPTEPGDVIVFDERLLHASRGGGRRRQWRVDFVADEGDDEVLREYYAGTFSPDWDGGYDVDRFPSFGRFWRSTHERWGQRPAVLGSLDAAQQEDDAARARRRGPMAAG